MKLGKTKLGKMKLVYYFYLFFFFLISKLIFVFFLLTLKNKQYAYKEGTTRKN